MKILLDANISYRLIKLIKPLYPEAMHVSRISLPHPSDDPVIWDWARRNNCAIIVSNDVDFKSLVQRYGPPPKVIYLRIGNVGNAPVLRLLTEKRSAIQSFLDNPDQDLMEITEIS